MNAYRLEPGKLVAHAKIPPAPPGSGGKGVNASVVVPVEGDQQQQVLF